MSRKLKEIEKDIKEYLLNDVSLIVDVVNEINCWNGSLGYFEHYENDDCMLNEVLSCDTPYNIMCRIYFGNWNPNDEWFRFDGYGNIQSICDYDLEQEMIEDIDEIVELLLDDYNNLDIDNEKLLSLLAEYEEVFEEED